MSGTHRRPWCTGSAAGVAALGREGHGNAVAMTAVEAFAECIQATDLAGGDLQRVAAALDLRATPSQLGPDGYAGWVILLEPCVAEPHPDDVLGLVIVPSGCQPGDAVLFTRRRAAA